MSVDPNVAVEFIISVRKDGNVGIQGPIKDKILSLGVLELAKKAVQDYVPAQTSLNGSPGIIKPDAY